MSSDDRAPLVVVCLCSERQADALALAATLDVPLLYDRPSGAFSEPVFAMVAEKSGWSLLQTGRRAPGPVSVDFLTGAVAHRRFHGGGKGQLIAKAVGVKAHVYPAIMDATAGLGRDAFVLATLGCHVRMYERSPAVHQLLADGLARGLEEAFHSEDSALQAILQRMVLEQGDALLAFEQFAAAPDQAPDVIYLDPMFPERTKSADVKKEMKAFHAVVGQDVDADALLAPALAAARFRVVVKRPKRAPDLNGQAPSHRVEGKSSRFDVYALRKLPERLNAPQ